MLKDKDRNIFHVIDRKRREKLQEKYNGYNKTMQPPLHEMDECQGCHYRLQLNIYKWILEKYYDLTVQDMKVVCVHPESRISTKWLR